MFRDVIALSFLSPCALRLRQKKRAGGWLRQSIPVEPRSAYLLQGEVREAWEHSIVPMAALRYSLTFRTFKPEYAIA